MARTPPEALFDNPMYAKPPDRPVEVAHVTTDVVLAVGNPASTAGAHQDDLVVPYGARLRWCNVAGTGVSEAVTGPEEQTDGRP